MNMQRIQFRSIAAIIFLTLSMSVPRAQNTTATDEQIKRNIVERLQQQVDDLKRILTLESSVRAALVASDYLHYQTVLERFDRQKNDYATAALDLIEKEKIDLANALNGTNYAKLSTCLSEKIDLKVSLNIKKIGDAIAAIEKSPPKAISSVLKEMLTNLNTIEKTSTKISDCLASPFEPRIAVASDQPLSVKWNSQCVASEHANPNGTTALTWPTVASILYDDGIRGPTAFCTGTLIAPNIVLTAAHCFCQTAAKQPGGRFLRTAGECSRGSFVRRGQTQAALDSRNHSVYFQHAGVFAIKQVILHPSFFWIDGLPNADIALLVLERPVTDITPTPINSIARLRPGTVGTAVGYGFFRPIRFDGTPAETIEIKQETGLKLQGQVITDVCPLSASHRGMICWTYRRRARGLSLGSTCLGDSGGPLFSEHRGQTYLVGITTAGGVNCNPGSRAYDTEIFQFRDWITENLRRNAFVVPAMRTPAGANQNKCLLCTFCNPELHQPSGDRKNNISIVSARNKRLRVSVNCTPSVNHSQLRLTVAQPGTSALPCDKETGPATVTSCEVPVKLGQEWKVTVDEIIDRQCQIVATTFDN